MPSKPKRARLLSASTTLADHVPLTGIPTLSPPPGLCQNANTLRKEAEGGAMPTKSDKSHGLYCSPATLLLAVIYFNRKTAVPALYLRGPKEPIKPGL